MASFNRVILMGNVTRDIELKYTQTQLAVAELGMAVNDKRKNAKGEWVEETTFVDVTCWGRQAEIASEYLTKGAPVFIEGRLKLDTWEKDGQKRSKMRVVCENLRLLSSRGGGPPGGGRGGRSSGPQYDESEYSGGSDMSDADYGGGGGGRGGSSSGGGSADDIPF